jgi:sugar lactone lactonase YvrE
LALAGALAASAQASLLSPTGSFGTPGSGPGQFQSPQGVAVQASSGNVFVADSQNGRIEKFSPTGSFIAAFGQGQLSLPSTIATDNLGKVYVGDAGTNTVKKFDANGQFLATIDGSTTPQGAFQRLVGVAVDQNNNLWTADGNTNNVTQFNSKGNFLRQWNDTHGQPSAIAVDSARNAVYLITQGSAIERWSLTGNYLAQIELPTFFGSEGFIGPSPSALALDRGTGNLYVDHRQTKADVTVYSPAGIKLDDLSLGSKTNSHGLAFASLQGGPNKPLQGRLYLSDASDNDVTIYSPRTSPGPPLVTSESVSQRGRTTATLGAGIVPLGTNTTCQFQYVKDAEFRASGFNNATNAACAPAGLGSSFTYQAATASISGLTLGAFYHFRVVATSSAGTTTGDEQEFQAGPEAWAPFNRCPVDDPAMLAADGSSTFGLCLSSNSTHGSIKIGNLPMATTGNTNLQAGLVGPNANQLAVISPPGGALVSDPVDIPNTPVGTVTAVTQSAGTPSDFNLFAGISTGVPIIALPIKIHLQNAALGPSCFIGSDQDPIVLHPENTDLSNAESIGGFFTFDPDGTPNLAGVDASLQITGAVQGDDTFAVPGAQGCGPNGDGSLDPLVNAVVGVPSPAGSNQLVLDDAASGLGFTASFLFGQEARTGQQFAADWHVGFGP